MNGKFFEDIKQPLFLFLKIVIVLITLFSFLFIFYYYYREYMLSIKYHMVLVLLYISIFVLFAITYHCFQIGKLAAKELIFSYLLSVCLSNGMIYIIIALTAEKIILVYPIIILTGMQIVASSIMYIISNRIYAKLNKAQNSIIIHSDTEYDLNMIRKFNSKKQNRFMIRKLLLETEPYEELIDSIDQFSTVILGNINGELREKLTAYCFESDKEILINPTIQDIMIYKSREVYIYDSAILQCSNSGFSLVQLFFKRLIDIVVSAICLIIASPIMLIAGVAIKLEDGGSVFYKQTRLTKDGKEFDIIKFRSMVEHAEEDGKARLSSQGDDRITKVGKIIRAMRIDETPQFLNILKGEMSLVGPRPERPEIFAYNCTLFSHFEYRIKVKAGLTGYAQIYGKYNTSFEDKAMMDLLYIEQPSLLLDLKLLFLTLKVIFIKDSTEGFDAEQSNEGNTGVVWHKDEPK